MKPQVSVILGSASDVEVMEETVNILRHFRIPFEVDVISAHRTPDRAQEFAKNARRRGISVIIAGAGMAAHLAGVLAAHTTVPVIGVPIDAGPLRGWDAMLSTLQMPGGIPVATMSIGKSGAKNAGILAAQILSVSNPELGKKLEAYKKEMAEQVEQKSRKIKEF